MNYNLSWTIFLILRCLLVSSSPVQSRNDGGHFPSSQELYNDSQVGSYDQTTSNEKVISVRITSSIAVGRGKPKSPPQTIEIDHEREAVFRSVLPDATHDAFSTENLNRGGLLTTVAPSGLEGANIEFIKQLNAKKDLRDYDDQVHSFQHTMKNINPLGNAGLLKESSIKNENPEAVPLARKIPSSSNYNNLYESQDVFVGHPLDDYTQHQHSNRTHNSPAISDQPFRGNNLNTTANIAQVNYKYMVPPVPSNLSNEKSKKVGKQNAGSNIKTQIGIDDTDDSVAEASIKSIYTDNSNKAFEQNSAVPPLPSQNYITNKQWSPGRPNSRLTTVSFNVVHDEPNSASNYQQPSSAFLNPTQTVPEQQFHEPKVYSQPAQVYSEPAKFYSEPAKIYGEPSKIYSEPAKVYSEPSKIYSEPAKFYSKPASLNLPPNAAPNFTPWQPHPMNPVSGATITNTTPVTKITNPVNYMNTPRNVEHLPEKNYEVDEKLSVMTNGRSHGIQESTTEKCKQENCKVGYVVEGRQFKKYRVEERTSDGFIVGEYGVVRNEDGALRGVRYTADSDASPRLIHDALMKFLQLK